VGLVFGVFFDSCESLVNVGQAADDGGCLSGLTFTCVDDSFGFGDALCDIFGLQSCAMSKGGMVFEPNGSGKQISEAAFEVVEVAFDGRG
jgi:hypothetical protein